MSYTFNGTPGPWRIQTREDNPHLVSSGKNSYNGVRDCQYGYLNTSYLRGFSITGCILIEDAHLIAAAPDLLQAIIHAMERIDIWGPKQFGLVPADPLATLVELQIIVTRFREAIHKALNIQPHETPLSNP